MLAVAGLGLRSSHGNEMTVVDPLNQQGYFLGSDKPRENRTKKEKRGKK